MKITKNKTVRDLNNNPSNENILGNCCSSFLPNENIKDSAKIPFKLLRLKKANIFVASISWIVLFLFPKCPMCFAAIFTLGMGYGISYVNALYLKTSILIICASFITYFLFKNVYKFYRS